MATPKNEAATKACMDCLEVVWKLNNKNSGLKKINPIRPAPGMSICPVFFGLPDRSVGPAIKMTSFKRVCQVMRIPCNQLLWSIDRHVHSSPF